MLKDSPMSTQFCLAKTRTISLMDECKCKFVYVSKYATESNADDLITLKCSHALVVLMVVAAVTVDYLYSSEHWLSGVDSWMLGGPFENHGQRGSFFIFKLVSLFSPSSLSFSTHERMDGRTDSRTGHNRLAVPNKRFSDARYNLDSNMCWFVFF